MDAADWDRRYAADGLLWTAQPNRFLVAEADDLSPGAALDLACGEGRNAIWLASRGWSVTAVDHSDVGLDKGKQLAASVGVEINWVLGDVTSYRSDPVFDLVVMLYLQVPRPQLQAALVGACGALDADGALLVVGHHSDNLESGIGGPQDPALLYTPDDITGMLDGLEIDKAETVERPVDRDGMTGIALDTLVRAHRGPQH